MPIVTILNHTINDKHESIPIANHEFDSIVYSLTILATKVFPQIDAKHGINT